MNKPERQAAEEIEAGLELNSLEEIEQNLDVESLDGTSAIGLFIASASGLFGG